MNTGNTEVNMASAAALAVGATALADDLQTATGKGCCHPPNERDAH